MPAGDLTSVANVKAQAGTVNSGADAVLQSLITQASAFIASVTDRAFTAAVAVTEIRDGSGGSELYLAEGPVQSITFTSSADTGVSVNGIQIPAQPADQQPGYFLVRNEVVALFGYIFTRGRKNVRVKYSAGYTAAPKDIEQACIELVVAAYRRVPRGPEMNSETFPQSGAVVSFKLQDIPAYAARIINDYRKVVPL